MGFVVSKRDDLERTEFKDIFTLKEKRLLESSWQYVVENCPSAGVTFYLTLFEECPETKALFPYSTLAPKDLVNDPLFQGQSQRILHAVSGKADEIVQTLGARHVEFQGYNIKYMDPFAEALILMLEEELDKKWTRPVERVWRKFLKKTSILMQMGAPNDKSVHN